MRASPFTAATEAVSKARTRPPSRRSTVRLAHRGLAERRQHLRDVAQEDRVRPDDEHALLVEQLPVLVEQERGAVQADRGLAGAGAALHDEARVERRADDDVLLGLDGGDDVAHRAGARALELGEQRVGDAPVTRSVDRVGIVEDLVEQVVELAARHHEPAAPAQPERVGRGGPVEGRRHAGPPVDDDRLAALVLDVAAADVPGGTGPAGRALLVDAPEGEPRDVDVERPEPLLEVPAGDLAVDGLGGHVLDGDGRLRSAGACRRDIGRRGRGALAPRPGRDEASFLLSVWTYARERAAGPRDRGVRGA